MTNKQHNKQSWLDRLDPASIPSFSANVRALQSSQSYSQQHAAELARKILQDPSLTASLLKLANSAYFNATGQPIRTVSRAIMVLGHRVIREICASCILMENYARGRDSAQLKAVLARSFHAAVQAKQIARMQGQRNTEELFIAALLLNLGEVGVYATLDPQVPAEQALLDQYPLTRGSEKTYLGCYFNELTLSLCEDWQISPAISAINNGAYKENSPLRSVLLGNSFAASCEIDGLEKAIKKHQKTLCRYTGHEQEQLIEKLNQSLSVARSSLAAMGLTLSVNQQASSADSEAKAAPSKVDKLVQLEVLQDLSSVPPDALEFNYLLQQLLEGIKRGGGFSRVIALLLTPDKSRLVARYALEASDGQLKPEFRFSCHHDVPELVQKVIKNRSVLSQQQLRERGMTRRKIEQLSVTVNALWGPLAVEGKVVGCFYADNGANGVAVGQEQQQAFELFVAQARLFLFKAKAVGDR